MLIKPIQWTLFFLSLDFRVDFFFFLSSGPIYNRIMDVKTNNRSLHLAYGMRRRVKKRFEHAIRALWSVRHFSSVSYHANAELKTWMEANTENKTVSIFFPVVGAHFSKGDENTTSKPDSTLQSFRCVSIWKKWKNKRFECFNHLEIIYQKTACAFHIHYSTQTNRSAIRD